MQQRPQKLLDPVRNAIRLKHDSIRTEEAVKKAANLAGIHKLVNCRTFRHSNKTGFNMPRYKPNLISGNTDVKQM